MVSRPQAGRADLSQFPGGRECRLLSRGGGKFTRAQPFRQALGERHGAILAIDGDQFPERGAQRGFREGLDVDAVQRGLGLKR